ncbi:ChrR family anti-sigma-E factor [Pararhizobium antarcticum]|uniref:Transcriptional regulator n=1 Tax=Pararhizobium antarcticum TaxID=1798805 RepID=A0A657LY13_9HYPH|nr:ChrR family anti-sigma-E factor [Pararhizobium antarcticum]OJF91029.1 transcriptional regulator [Rhizobium sp. 58]OJF99959.1 transcriptional regulator [Pararhizobium antarcticum]
MAGDDLNTVDALIAHYAAGILPEPARVLVAAHLEIQAVNRPKLLAFETLAGDLLEKIEPAPMASRESRLEEIFLSKVDTSQRAERPARPKNALLPPSLRDFVGFEAEDIPWKTKLPGFKEYIVGDFDGFEVSFFWIRPGRAVPAHTHKGCEFSLVLDGAFQDARGRYGPGDISVADDSVDHRPIAENDRPCIGFAVVDAPLKLTGSLRQMIGDLIG